jgi:UDP-N-acetylmuramoylalanine--D-glutamate ligase
MYLINTKTDALILMGEAKERFLQAAKTAGVQNIHVVDTFDDAVMLAHSLAKAPQVVLLSPACSSFDMFENFPH